LRAVGAEMTDEARTGAALTAESCHCEWHAAPREARQQARWREERLPGARGYVPLRRHGGSQAEYAVESCRCVLRTEAW
jgi:hypothetical protein